MSAKQSPHSGSLYSSFFSMKKPRALIAFPWMRAAHHHRVPPFGVWSTPIYTKYPTTVVTNVTFGGAYMKDYTSCLRHELGPSP